MAVRRGMDILETQLDAALAADKVYHIPQDTHILDLPLSPGGS